jgi:outer membrane receptor protein involved in Fe transport
MGDLPMPRTVPAGLTAAVMSLLIPAHASLAASAVTTNPGELDEIVVTAEKRESTVQQTAISMTAISGELLQEHGVQTVEDLMGTVPGVSIRTAGPGQTEYEMRGLASSGGSTAVVGFYLDDTPLAASTQAGTGRTVIEPDLFDLNNIEVLRGPQGTLYGAGSMGGTIKLVSNPPKLGAFESAISADASQTDGGSTNGGGSLMLNFPIGDIAALRLVNTDKYISGWIDRKVVADPTTGVFPFPTGLGAGCGSSFYFCNRGDVANATVLKDIKGSNLERYFSSRATLLVKPSEALSVTGTLLYQRIDADGYNAYQGPPGSSSLAIFQPYDLQTPYYSSFKLASLNVTYATDVASVTSSTSYWQRQSVQNQDSTEALQDLFNFTQFIPVTFQEQDSTQQLSEELRVASNGSGPLQWVGGIFITNLHSGLITVNQNPAFATATVCTLPYSGGSCPAGQAYNPNNGGAAANPNGIIFDANNPNVTKQQAVFGEVSYKFTPDLKLTTGLRFYKFQVTNLTDQSGLGGATGNATPSLGSASGSGSGVLPKVNLAYTPTDDLTVYGTVSKGSRPGGVNIAIPLTLCGPGSGTYYVTSEPNYFGPDSVWSFELGEKARFADRRVTVNADVFYIKWIDIQQVANLSCGFTYQSNAGQAKSYGPEFEVAAKLTDALTAELSGAYTQAFINDPNPSSGIAPGTRILNVPKYTGSLALSYETMLGDQLRGTARISDAYVGPSEDTGYYRETISPYALVDARAGIGKNRWTTYLYANNLTNKHAGMTINNTVFGWQGPTFTQFTTNQPRTVGLQYQTKF